MTAPKTTDLNLLIGSPDPHDKSWNETEIVKQQTENKLVIGTENIVESTEKITRIQFRDRLEVQMERKKA